MIKTRLSTAPHKIGLCRRVPHELSVNSHLISAGSLRGLRSRLGGSLKRSLGIAPPLSFRAQPPFLLSQESTGAQSRNLLKSHCQACKAGRGNLRMSFLRRQESIVFVILSAAKNLPSTFDIPCSILDILYNHLPYLSTHLRIHSPITNHEHPASSIEHRVSLRPPPPQD